MWRRRFITIYMLFLAGFSAKIHGSDLKLKSFYIIFWNVENYFDPFDDPLTDDQEFTPSGDKRWTWSKFLKKRDAIAKTIIASGDENGDYPLLVGLAEVENGMVLSQLCHQTALAKLNYRFIHRDSPDRRGIDVALLYREEYFEPLYIRDYFMKLPDSLQTTRSVLYVKGVVYGYDTLHILVNHWPSKIGGNRASLPRRVAVAGQVRSICDSIFRENSNSNIVLMGDFNDTPDSPPLKHLGLINPIDKQKFKKRGTIKYKGEWELIDHFFISGALLENHPEVTIFSPDFLLEDDTAYYGKKPFRTYLGPRYLGGVSDHLPISLKMSIFTL